MKTLSTYPRPPSLRQANFIRGFIIATKFFILNRTRLNSRSSNRAKATAFPGYENKYSSFQEKTRAFRHIDDRGGRGSDETLICPLIFARARGHKRNIRVKGEFRKNVDVAPGIIRFLVLFCCSFAASFSGTDIYFAIAADKYS